MIVQMLHMHARICLMQLLTGLSGHESTRVILQNVDCLIQQSMNTSKELAQ